MAKLSTLSRSPMQSKSFGFKDWTVGTKLTTFTFALVSLILLGLVLTVSWTTSSMLRKRAVDNINVELHGVVNTVELFNQAMTSQATSYGRIFASGLEGDFSLDPQASVKVGALNVPTLLLGGKPLNLDFAAPDRFTRQTGGNA
ncbi:MAG: methyl-accepting chemotaxis protein, partial [Oxalobacteraceae bacterium]